MSATLTSGTYPRRSPSTASRGWSQRLWQALTALGQRRATAQLGHLALHYQHTNPALARQLRQAAGDLLKG